MSSEKFSDRLRQSRLKRGLKQKDAATILGIQPGYLSELEKGKKNNPSDSLLLRICREFSVSREWLLGEERENGEPEQGLDSPPSMEMSLPEATALVEALKERKIEDAMRAVPTRLLFRLAQDLFEQGKMELALYSLDQIRNRAQEKFKDTL